MQQQYESANHQAGIMGGASLYYFAIAIYNAAPPWQLVPPICFGIAALWNAWTNHRFQRAAKG